MENYYSDSEVEEDALSLCDLPLHDQNDNDDNELPEPQKTSTLSDPEEDFFEFCVDPIRGYFPMDAIVFCGKSIPCSKPITVSTQHTQIENPFFSRSESLKISSSHRSPGSKAPPVTGNFRSQSSNSRKHKVAIGLVKYQPEMDMNEIRKRQARRAPAPMFRVINGGEKEQPVVACGRSGGKGHWGLMRLLRCRSHLLSALAKTTLGCMPRV